MVQEQIKKMEWGGFYKPKSYYQLFKMKRLKLP